MAEWLRSLFRDIYFRERCGRLDQGSQLADDGCFRALASYRLSFGASLIAALINGVFGLVVAWNLVRYRFPFRRLVDGLDHAQILLAVVYAHPRLRLASDDVAVLRDLRRELYGAEQE